MKKNGPSRRRDSLTFNPCAAQAGVETVPEKRLHLFDTSLNRSVTPILP